MDILELFKNAFFQQYRSPIQIGSDEYAASSVFAYCLQVLLSQLNDAASQRFVSSARGEYLDAIAESWGILERPQGSPAFATFFMTGLGTLETLIPVRALRVSDTEGKYIFTNPEEIVFSRMTSAKLVCETVGTAANNIPADSLSTIVSGDEFIRTISQTTATGGGVDSMEDDDEAFRQYVILTMQSQAGAGTAMAYEAKARLADPRVMDAHVITQDEEGYEKGKVKIYIVPESSDEEVVMAVQLACSSPDFRPIGDKVITYESEVTGLRLSPICRVVYEARFASLADRHNAEVKEAYSQALKSKIGKPLIYSDFASMLKTPDAQGVYATDVVFLGLNTNATLPIYPPRVGGRITITNISFDNVFIETEN
jgi:phage-related baseplate assembly protein